MAKDDRKAEELAGKGSVAAKLAEERKKKKKRLDEIMGQMGHNRSGKYN